MTEGFYEQLGVPVDAPTHEVRAAYAARVAQILKRRRAIVDQGGDPSPLDLTRVQLDEAHAVLIDPIRRRRYDALRALSADQIPTGPDAEEELWKRASGALVSPAAGAAAELVRVCTSLKVGALPPVPRPVERENERTVTMPGRPRMDAKPLRAEGTDGRVVPLHAGATVTPKTSSKPATDPGLRVVETTRTGAAPVVVLPSATAKIEPPRAPEPPKPKAAPKPLSSEDLARLVDAHGWSGGLFRAVREARGITVQGLSDTTRISARYLEAIEGESQDALPSATFVRGYVREIARQLGLDEEAAVTGYLRRIKG